MQLKFVEWESAMKMGSRVGHAWIAAGSGGKRRACGGRACAVLTVLHSRSSR
jgi:hypothetical protein